MAAPPYWPLGESVKKLSSQDTLEKLERALAASTSRGESGAGAGSVDFGTDADENQNLVGFLEADWRSQESSINAFQKAHQELARRYLDMQRRLCEAQIEADAISARNALRRQQREARESGKAEIARIAQGIRAAEEEIRTSLRNSEDQSIGLLERESSENRASAMRLRRVLEELDRKDAGGGPLSCA